MKSGSAQMFWLDHCAFENLAWSDVCWYKKFKVRIGAAISTCTGIWGSKIPVLHVENTKAVGFIPLDLAKN